MKKLTVYYEILLACLVLLLFVACTPDEEPEAVPEDTGTFELECTGGATFTATGTLKAQLVHETNQTCTGCSPSSMRLSLYFDAPGNEWTQFSFSVWNDGDTLVDKLYLVYPFEPGENVDTGESVTGILHNTEFQRPWGWVYVDRGQVDFEFYAPGRAKGWFSLVMPSNVPREPEVEDLTISGTFDTPYERITRSN